MTNVQTAFDLDGRTYAARTVKQRDKRRETQLSLDTLAADIDRMEWDTAHDPKCRGRECGCNPGDVA